MPHLLELWLGLRHLGIYGGVDVWLCGRVGEGLLDIAIPIVNWDLAGKWPWVFIVLTLSRGGSCRVAQIENYPAVQGLGVLR